MASGQPETSSTPAGKNASGEATPSGSGIRNPESGARRLLNATPMNRQRIRKSVTELLEADFAETPAWEFALDEECVDGQNETTVRPWLRAGSIDPSEGMFVVRASFVLADGTAMTGYLTPPSRSQADLGTLQPTIITGQGHVSFWCGMATPSAEHLQRNYDRLGRSAFGVFPIRFHSDVPLVSGAVQGEIAGFMVLEDFTTKQTRTVR